MMLESVGGKKIPWMVMSESWVMPFSKGNYPNEKSKKIITLLHETGRITRQEAVSCCLQLFLNRKVTI